jgi:hypothetical protein
MVAYAFAGRSHCVVGGRRTIGGKGPATSLSWRVNDELDELAERPGGDDSSHPGFVELSPTHGPVSWYSSHERRNGRSHDGSLPGGRGDRGMRAASIGDSLLEFRGICLSVSLFSDRGRRGDPCEREQQAADG